MWEWTLRIMQRKPKDSTFIVCVAFSKNSFLIVKHFNHYHTLISHITTSSFQNSYENHSKHNHCVNKNKSINNLLQRFVAKSEHLHVLHFWVLNPKFKNTVLNNSISKIASAHLRLSSSKSSTSVAKQTCLNELEKLVRICHHRTTQFIVWLFLPRLKADLSKHNRPSL